MAGLLAALAKMFMFAFQNYLAFYLRKFGYVSYVLFA